MHASTRILLVILSIAAIASGWWVLLAINTVAVGVMYSVLWTVAVLTAARVLTAAGFGYNRLTARRRSHAPPHGADPATALAELSDLLERRLITPDEHAAKRASVLDRL